MPGCRPNAAMMPFSDWPHLVAVVGGIAGSAFALVRMVLNQQQTITTRLVSFLESSLQRQESALDSLGDSIQRLSNGIQENTNLLRRATEGVDMRFGEDEDCP